MPVIARADGDCEIELTGFGRPFGFAMDRHRRIHVADMDVHGVARLTDDLTHFQWLGIDGAGWTEPAVIEMGRVPPAPRRTPDLLDGPHSVAINGEGELWINTYYTPGLHRFDVEGRHCETVVRLGPVTLTGPATTRFDNAGKLWVTEYALHCALVFQPVGEAEGALGGGAVDGLDIPSAFAAGDGAGWFDRPHMTTQLADDTFVVADTWNHRLQRYGDRFEWLGWLGAGVEGWCMESRPARADAKPGWLHAPVAVGALADGRFVVTDWGNNRLQWFGPEGRLLHVMDDLGLSKPYDAQVLDDRLVIADAHNHRVLIKRAPWA